MNEFEAARTTLSWIDKLSGPTKTVLTIAVMVTSALSSFIYFQTKSIDARTTAALPAIQKQLTDITARMAEKEAADKLAFANLFIEVAQVNDRLATVEKKTDDVIFITAANTNSALLNMLMPRLNNMKEDFITFILSIQKEEAVNRLDSLRIESRRRSRGDPK